ncbi:MAG TPA: AAA family ATPase [Gemmataceae bacterium]|nr:AAA family ATPase [Gemmataceae bacterium]
MSDRNGMAVGDETGDRLNAFVHVVETRNPFLDNRINGPSAHDVDVDAIHQAAFARLTRLAREACESRRGVGVVLWGEAGIGKSHLLSRLGRWANYDKQACFAYLHNLQAAPEHLPRSLLNSVVNILTGGRDRRFAGTDLFDLVHASLLDAVQHKLGGYSWPQLRNAYGRLVERLGSSDLPGATLIDRTVWNVLFQLFRSAYRANRGKEDGSVASLAVRWLSGQALDPEDARVLELPPPSRADESVALLDNQQIKQVLVALTRLAASKNRPFVLVFDQVDNLDEEQAAALARFLEALIDSSPNLLVVTAGVQDTLVRWHQNRIIQESAWDRLAQEEIMLQRLQPPEAAAIIEARLRHLLEPFADIELVQKRRGEDALFPLGEAWRQRFLADRVDIRPRDAINRAREGWRQQQESLARHDPLDWLRRWPRDSDPGPGRPDEPTTEEIAEAIDRKIAEKLASISEQLEREPQTLPADADHLAGLVYSFLAQCRDAGHRYGVWEVERVAPAKHARPTYHLSLRRRDPKASADLRTAVLFLVERSAIAVSGFLRRLLNDWGTYDRVVLVTAERVGLPLGQAGREYLEDLQQRGRQHFLTMQLAFAELVELEALQRVVGLARSRDLEIEPSPSRSRTVSEQEVIEAYCRHERYLKSSLLRALLQAPSNTAAIKGSETMMH